MGEHAILTARLLLWALCAGAVVLPLRWAFVCMILASHLDITTASFTSSSSIGFENSIRIVALPTILLLRTRFRPLKDFDWGLPHKLWIALILYAGIASFWSEFPLSAVKMVIYLMIYLIIYMIFLDGWRNGLIDARSVKIATLAVLALAVVQTYVLGNYAGTEDRLTSFSTPQYFAAYLLAVLAILLFSGEGGLLHGVCCASVVLAIVLSGSRYIFVSMIALGAIAAFRPSARSRKGPAFKSILVRSALIGTVAVIGTAALIKYFPTSRVDELLEVTNTRDAAIEDIGTLAWRLGIYSEIMDQLKARSPRQFFFGSGTSSGAGLMLDFQPSLYVESGVDGVDGNRVLHSEFLRSLYEWGIPGIAILSLFVVCVCAAFARKLAVEGPGSSLAFLGVFPSIVFGLAIENLLAGAGSAAGIGIVLALTFAWQGPRVALRDSRRGKLVPSDGALLKAGA